MTIWRMRIACCITKATDTHSEYVILIAFPLQQWLPEVGLCNFLFYSAEGIQTDDKEDYVLRAVKVAK